MNNKEQLVNHLLTKGKSDSWVNLYLNFLGDDDKSRKAKSDYVRKLYSSLKALVNKPKSKVLIYDIETTYLTFNLWRGGKQYVSYRNLANTNSETRIITIAYKYLGEKDVTVLTWDNDTKSDKDLVTEFLSIYNSADAVIGVNNNSFDNKIVKTRAAKYRLPINNYVRSIDVQKIARRNFKLESYSMKYMCEYFGLTLKLGHEGFDMWRKIQETTGKESDKALYDMALYNIGDIEATEDLYNLIIQYSKPKVNLSKNDNKFANPISGSTNLKLYQIQKTAAGYNQYIMKDENGLQHKLSQTQYNKFINE